MEQSHEGQLRNVYVYIGRSAKDRVKQQAMHQANLLIQKFEAKETFTIATRVASIVGQDKISRKKPSVNVWRVFQVCIMSMRFKPTRG